MKRTVIKIDERLCNGCGACVTGCHEGALQLIDGKAVMVSDLYCDGLGACIGECPVGAITFEKREAEPYSEEAVMERIAPKGPQVILAHLNHLEEHGQTEFVRQGLDYLKRHDIPIDFHTEEKAKPLACGCPGTMMRDLRGAAAGGFIAAPHRGAGIAPASGTAYRQPSELRQFPVQLRLLAPQAPFLQGAELLLAADCTAFASGEFHGRFLRGKMLAIGCPKLDGDLSPYVDKLVAMIDVARIDTLTVLVMEVPCCAGLIQAARAACRQAERKIPLKEIVLSVEGDVVSEEWSNGTNN